MKRKRAYYFALLINKKFIITIKAIFTTRDYVLTFLILSSSIYIAR
ncbi:hypothetical protein CSPX01_10306 [Colletotrichum filicis]|nr:hypothetical protein CSPX01_10306 [Colletotrichum filicis]